MHKSSQLVYFLDLYEKLFISKFVYAWLFYEQSKDFELYTPPPSPKKKKKEKKKVYIFVLTFLNFQLGIPLN